MEHSVPTEEQERLGALCINFVLVKNL